MGGDVIRTISRVPVSPAASNTTVERMDNVAALPLDILQGRLLRALRALDGAAPLPSGRYRTFARTKDGWALFFVDPQRIGLGVPVYVSPSLAALLAAVEEAHSALKQRMVDTLHAGFAVQRRANVSANVP